MNPPFLRGDSFIRRNHVMEERSCRILAEGQVYIEYGPAAMKVLAYANGEPLTELCCRAVHVIHRALEEISASGPLLRRYSGEIDPTRLSGLPRIMYDAVARTEEPTLTPMAAVAGTVADAVADWLFSCGATVAAANNGGDIALRLAPGNSIRLRTVRSLLTGTASDPIVLRAEDGIGGICTSGLGGRSFTRGVVESLSVFSSRASQADALATHLANCSYIPSERVASTLAKNLDPSTDIPELSVVTAVDTLTEEERRQAVSQVLEEAKRQYARSNYICMRGYLQGETFFWPE